MSSLLLCLRLRWRLLLLLLLLLGVMLLLLLLLLGVMLLFAVAAAVAGQICLLLRVPGHKTHNTGDLARVVLDRPAEPEPQHLPGYRVASAHDSHQQHREMHTRISNTNVWLGTAYFHANCQATLCGRPWQTQQTASDTTPRNVMGQLP